MKLTVGTADGANANMIYVAGTRTAVAQVHGLPMHQEVSEVENDPRYAEGWAIAKMLAAAPGMKSALEHIAEHSSQSDLRGMAREALASLA